MKLFVNLARLEIGLLFTQGTRQGHPCTFDTFLVQSYHNGVWLQQGAQCSLYYAASLKYYTPDTWHDTTPSTDTESTSPSSAL